MIKFVFAVKDRASEILGTPIFVAAKGIAIRSFTDEVNRNSNENMMYQHPDDFELWYLGQYDDSDGTLNPLIKPEIVLRAKDVKTN